MPDHTPAYIDLIKGIAARKRTLLRNSEGKLIVPKPGTVWFPNRREQSLCEGYIVLIAAEIEVYLESVADKVFDIYLSGYRASFLSQCGAGSEFYNKFQKKQSACEDNHNTSLVRIGGVFEFIGLSREKFPPGIWDDIDAITVERGSIVHQGIGVRNVTDPRAVLTRVDRLLVSLRAFDIGYTNWINQLESELVRMQENPIRITMTVDA